MILPDSVIAREKSGILMEYLQKVFCERCGMDLKVELEFVGDAGKVPKECSSADRSGSGKCNPSCEIKQ